MLMVGQGSGKGRQLCPCQCHPDLSWMKFGASRIAFMDVDALFTVERRGHFLFIEWKEEGEALGEGQRIYLEQLSLVPKFQVMVIRGEKGDPRRIELYTRGVKCWPEPIDKGLLQERIHEWFKKANGNT